MAILPAQQIEVPAAVIAAAKILTRQNGEEATEAKVVEKLKLSPQVIAHGRRLFDVTLGGLYYDPSGDSLVGSITVEGEDDNGGQNDLYVFCVDGDYAAAIKRHPPYCDDTHDGTVYGIYHLGGDVRQFVQTFQGERIANLRKRIDQVNKEAADLLDRIS